MANRCLTDDAHLGRMRLPPIPRKKETEQNLMQNDDILLNLPRLPRIERCPFVQTKISPALTDGERNRKMSNPCLKRKGILKLSTEARRNTVAYVGGGLPRNEQVEVSATSQKDHSPKQDMATISPIDEKAFRRPVHLLRRRIKPERVYRHGHGQMSHEELLAFDQNMDQLRVFTDRDKKMEMRDFYGTKFDPNRTDNGDVTSYTAVFELEYKSGTIVRDSTCAAKRKSPKNMLPSKKETKARVEVRFLEALDLHFYHYYRNTHPGRRMAICEEIERNICTDNVALSSVRDTLRLQEVLNSWML